jgi:hypothetical protein
MNRDRARMNVKARVPKEKRRNKLFFLFLRIFHLGPVFHVAALSFGLLRVGIDLFPAPGSGSL